MVTRILLTGLVIAALMAGVKDGRVLKVGGLTGSCAVVQTRGDGTQLEACKAGKLEGLPSLSRQGCSTMGQFSGREYWKCPAPISP